MRSRMSDDSSSRMVKAQVINGSIQVHIVTGTR